MSHGYPQHESGDRVLLVGQAWRKEAVGKVATISESKEGDSFRAVLEDGSVVMGFAIDFLPASSGAAASIPRLLKEYISLGSQINKIADSLFLEREGRRGSYAERRKFRKSIKEVLRDNSH